MNDLVPVKNSADESQLWYAEVPRSINRLIAIGLIMLLVCFGGFGVWSFSAPLAAAVIAQGSFVATGRNKIVQHLEGGIIEDIKVVEGQSVQAGQVLMTLDQTSAQANERELFIRKLRLQAMTQRLLAEYGEQDRLVFSPDLVEASDDVEVMAILDGQKLSFDVSRKTLLNDVALLERNMEALKIRSSGFEAQLDSMMRRAEILQEEYEAKSQLYEKGLVRKGELNTIRRVQAEAEGQQARLQAEAAEINQMLLKYEEQIMRTRSAYREAALDELGVIEADLESVREKSRQARSVLDRAVVRAPVTGTVVRLHYHTPGGVIETGEPIAEILPADAPLIIEAQIPRTEIDSVITGQTASVRLIALNQRTTPVLYGEVFYISADALPEQTTGSPQEVYLARISLTPDELQRVSGFIPTPGMPAEIMIQTEERTFAAYIAKPVSDSMSRAFREH
ncbi:MULTISPECIES: HlyD family type I secretion periplasmic adaptor subunit [unclassified Ruegeria]|uniref:HlyD family type I secretion periplasmic adaptor subunit n=1 Tax=unclassified Ruegeria TaxID=2625375 RepID=UPI0014915F5F|nr:MULTISPECIES: HlyD family type I secretion periplasmic adaptor subunit [unclassified Ruegeria]NOD89449.1 HlyD family type I secretion periplasmic adaptor subunit [Ruegeria sp. HKCCD4318]NOE13772.1 HlyD family type I secretion periplasmic adaptor subunit [Ruegeria sp. HKCCD4318-2]NOG08293.1 HlyD family type I secretion periplasmic adaptor subunit [Ruegeria sp. HKCCD4315]